MELTNTFTVSLPVDEAWRALTDLERVAPCMPGAAITSVEGPDHHWSVKVKVGPVSSKYAGVARFVERDDGAHRAVIEAKGRDAGGQGNVAATVAATLTAQGEGTLVRIDTDLAMSGRVAQFGRGVIADVSGKMFDEFAQRLEREVGGGSSGPSLDGAQPAEPAPSDDAIDLVGMSRSALLTRVGPLLAGFVAGIAVAAVAQLLRRGRQAPPPPWPPWAAYPPFAPPPAQDPDRAG